MSDQVRGDSLKRLGQEFRQARLALGINLRAFAEMAAMDHTTLSRIETGNRMPTSVHLTKLLRTFQNIDPTGFDTSAWVRVLHETIDAKVTTAPDRSLRVRTSSTASTLLTQAPVSEAPPLDPARFDPREAPRPDSVQTVKELIDGLNAVWVWAEKPPLRVMAARLQRNERVVQLGKSSLHNVLTATTLPKWENCKALLYACGVGGDFEWHRAWYRVAALEHQKKRASRS